MGNQKKLNRTIKHIFLILLVVAGGLLGAGYLWSEITSLGLLPVQFKTAQGSAHFKVEIADTVPERMKGLMFRKEMASDRGMMFVFEEPQISSFFMKNTYISLDMIFVGADKKVVGIIRDVPILNEQSRTIDVPSLYVIELVAGSAKRAGIEVGTEVLFDESRIER